MPNFVVKEIENNIRLDQYLINNLPDYSRSFFQKLINIHGVLVNNQLVKKNSSLLKTGDIINLIIPDYKKDIIPEDLDVKILLDQEDFFIIYKPAGLITHSDISTQSQVTLVDWLLYKFPYLSAVGPEEQRAIVHRLDKDTSGILIIPKNNETHEYFLNLFRTRKIKKTYFAIVAGELIGSGEIDFPITRCPHAPYKMTHKIVSGRAALTKYNSIKYFPEKNISLVKLEPLTGRTHQIRVHLSAIGYPIIGDTVYNAPSNLISRQALHAYKLQFWYKDQYFVIWHDIPEDMQELIKEN